MRKSYSIGQKLLVSNGSKTKVMVVCYSRGNCIRVTENEGWNGQPISYGTRLRYMSKNGNYQYSDGHINGKYPPAWVVVDDGIDALLA